MSFDQTYDKTAFNIPVTETRKSVISAFFREVIPDTIFKVATKVNGVVTTHANAAAATGYADAINGELVLKAGTHAGDTTILFTRRHPKFHANRGKMFSTSLFYDTLALGDHEIGFVNFNDTTLAIEDGLTFQMINGVCYANIYSLGVQTYHAPIDLGALAALNIDFAKGHLLDIQAQLRDVGNVFWFLSGKTSNGPKMIHEFLGLNAQSNVTVSSPAMHGVYIVRNNAGVQSQIRSGCLDISNESQDEDIQSPFTFFNAADVANVGSGGTVLIAVRVPFTYSGRLNTRDSQYYKCSVTTDKRANVDIYLISNQTLLTKGAGAPLVDTDWTSVTGTSLQYIDNSSGLITGFNLTGLSPIDGTALQAASTFEMGLPSPERIPVVMSHGDVLVVVGFGTPAAAAMNVQGLFFGEGI